MPGRPLLTFAAAAAIAASALVSAAAMQEQTPLAPQSTAAPLSSPQEVERLRAYQVHLAGAVGRLPSGTTVDAVLRLLLRFARERSRDQNPELENRAAFLAQMFFVTQWPLHRLVPEARNWPRPAPIRIILRGREDLAQHFTVSALIASAAGSPIADLAGLYKELGDARRGSGFSFSDIAADRAGTVLGTFATKSAASARLVQALGAGELTEADVMPDVSGLPDNLSQADFDRRFGGAGNPAYREQMDEIERRIAALRVVRALGASR